MSMKLHLRIIPLLLKHFADLLRPASFIIAVVLSSETQTLWTLWSLRHR